MQPTPGGEQNIRGLVCQCDVLRTRGAFNLVSGPNALRNAPKAAIEPSKLPLPKPQTPSAIPMVTSPPDTNLLPRR
jgi:hypothetical protein